MGDRSIPWGSLGIQREGLELEEGNRWVPGVQVLVLVEVRKVFWQQEVSWWQVAGQALALAFVGPRHLLSLEGGEESSMQAQLSWSYKERKL